ncbi:NmrA family NAD(P)-binding protein [Streptomyces sp. NPDC048516]|uniref:NmrA family NAD(P)-binding protein n=1 Tax=Streptomyces sp. NPDC048516 TaxID=3365565 RepID=UPI0037232137
MYVVMGAGGQTGGAVAHTLLEHKQPVRVVLRPGRDGSSWTARGAEVAFADVTDADALTAALTGAHAAYVLNPPDYTGGDMFRSARQVAEAYRSALATTGTRAVALSSIGAQHAEGTGNIATTHILEATLAPLGASFVRAGNFLSNWLSSLPAMRDGLLTSFFTPLDRPVPHTAAADIAATVVRELRRPGTRTVEIAAPADYSPLDVAAAFSQALGRPVTARDVPRAQWQQALADRGMPARLAADLIAMWDGFNSGHICFEGTPERGTVTLADFAARAVRQEVSA